MARKQKDMTRDRLDSLCLLVTDGTHDSPKLRPDGIPFIKGKHISGGLVDFDNCDYIMLEDHIKAIQRSKPEYGDTLFSNIGSVGDAAYVNTRNEFSIKNVALFKPNPRVVGGKYLYYVVIGPKFKGELFAKRSGVAQPFFSLEMLRSHEVEYHCGLPTQRKIASILSAYDDLIENNLRRIKILEEMAQALYREWFVKFRFPGHEKVRMVDSPLGKIPEGWEVKTLDEFGEIITGKTPSKKRPEYYGHYIPFIKLPDMHGNIFCLKTQDNLSRLGAESQRTKTIPPNNLCVSCIGTGGIVIITSVASQTNQQINSIILRNETDLEFLYFTLVDLKETIVRYGATGATMTNLSRGKFTALQVVSPGELLVGQFHNLMVPAFQSIRNLQQRNQTLRQTRDFLLPRLISGELDVSDLEIHVPEEAT